VIIGLFFAGITAFCMSFVAFNSAFFGLELIDFEPDFDLTTFGTPDFNDFSNVFNSGKCLSSAKKEKNG